MENSEKLQLPYIMPQQAQKHVTHNEAIRKLDALVQLSVISRVMVEPPAFPDAGDRYLVPLNGQGLWENLEGQVAAFQDGAWAYFAPQDGWLSWITDEELLVVFQNGEWQKIEQAGDILNNRAMVGVNAEADLSNRFTVSSAATLFTHEGTDHRIVINKNAAQDTASVVYQTNYTGHAEAGLTGDNHFHLKVSDDGTQWFSALTADPATGNMTIPSLVTNDFAYSPAVLDVTNEIYLDPINGNNANSGKTASQAIQTFAEFEKRIIIGRHTRLLLLNDVDLDCFIRFGEMIPLLEIMGRDPLDTTYETRKVRVLNAINFNNQIGGFLFHGPSSILLYKLDIELKATRNRSFIKFKATNGFVRSNYVSVSRPATGNCTLYGDQESFVPSCHNDLALDPSASGYVATGVGPGQNPNLQWCYPCNLTSL